MMKRTALLLTLALLSGARPALAAADAAVGPEGQSLGTAADAAACPYIAALQSATAGSFEALIMKIGTAEGGGKYSTRSPSNYLGKYMFGEAALQICVMEDADPNNNNYGADLNDPAAANPPGGAPAQQHTTSLDLESWKPGACVIPATDLASVSANLSNSDDFLNNPCMQEALMRKELIDNATALMADGGVQQIMCKKVVGAYTVEHNPSAANLGAVQSGGAFITPSGLLYAAHVMGVDGLKNAISIFLSGGTPTIGLNTYGPGSTLLTTATSPPSYSKGTLMTDGFDTPWTTKVAFANYFKVPGVADFDCTASVTPGNITTLTGNGGTVTTTTTTYTPPQYGTPPQTSTDYPFDKPGDIATLPPPAKSMKQIVHEIRKRAGVPDTEIAENPSYNEMMLAMTKEKFFDPTYYTNMADDIGAIQQQQTLTDAWINIQMKDIYDLQEKINALLAARASIKYNAERRPARAENVPMH